MSTVNGKTVPTSLVGDGSYSYDITGGTMKLTNDGKFSVVTNYRQTVPGSVSNFVDSTGGNWTQSGGTLQLSSSDGSSGTATFDKSTLTLSTSELGVTLTVVYGNKK
jgi:hypothetical protein